MQIIKVSASPRTVTAGQVITFVFQIIDEGLRDSSGNGISDSSGVVINQGLVLGPIQ